tara:strand:+ start:418 stop:795 length:378 start_codon:yes stop_codon:yes gene_type:complete
MILITATGNVGRAETRSMPNGDKVTNFSVASNRKIKGEEKTTWLNCVAFGGLAEMLERHLAKGTKVFVTGDYDHREWEKDGVKQHRVECRVDKFEFIGSKQDTSNKFESKPESRQNDFEDDELPF